MNLKKMIILNAILTFVLCFLTHFVYTLLPNPVFAIFFPVNESIWEHMKMLYTTILLYGIIEYLIIKKYNLYHNNFMFSLLMKSIISIPIYLLMFLPIYLNFGENMIVTFIILFITILIVNYIGYKILSLHPISYQKEISIAFIIIVYILMGLLTFKAPHREIFFDSEDEKYGINDYLIKK